MIEPQATDNQVVIDTTDNQVVIDTGTQAETQGTTVLALTEQASAIDQIRTDNEIKAAKLVEMLIQSPGDVDMALQDNPVLIIALKGMVTQYEVLINRISKLDAAIKPKSDSCYNRTQSLKALAERFGYKATYIKKLDTAKALGVEDCGWYVTKDNEHVFIGSTSKLATRFLENWDKPQLTA